MFGSLVALSIGIFNIIVVKKLPGLKPDVVPTESLAVTSPGPAPHKAHYFA